ncbi:DUF6584 family protein [Streptomyces massasporeus]|uniref:DUF6584 family protein n=1 Tax=Streptomyces massasporeus TaxID=67324 RepID=UPI0036F0635C
MPLRDTLARVDADLAAGRVPVARQRLRGLVSSYPNDLPLRRRLAEVYRLYAEPAEAGRWMYLEQDRDEAETAAFEARYRSAPQRMRAPREQRTAVRAACSEAVGHAVDWDTPLSNFPAGAGCPGERTRRRRRLMSPSSTLDAAMPLTSPRRGGPASV